MKLLFTSVFALLVFFPIAHAQTTNNEISVAGIKEKVTIHRDARWIPYIDAKNDADVYFAQGYVNASDRLWQADQNKPAFNVYKLTFWREK